jgi:acetyltransferase-like isoleucine patch superfamily enzyme
MQQTFLSIMLARYRKFGSTIRKARFKMLGLNIKNGGRLGKITCEWPSNVFIGNKCIIQDGVDFRIGRPFSETNIIKIGDRVFIGRCCEFNSDDKIIIGNNCLIASNTTFADMAHQTGLGYQMNNKPVISKEIIIGDDVWIGSKSIILKGVTIGSGVVVGAGSLVNKSIPEYEIWAGSPARFIKKRT